MKFNPYPHFLEFWQRNPALYYGLAVLLGTAFALNFSWILIFPLLIIGFSNQPLKVVLFAILGIVGFFYSHLSYQFPDLPEQGIQGKAHLSITSVRLKKTFYGKQWAYHGRIKSFENIAKNINFSLNLPFDEKIKRPPANQDYLVEGTLRKTQKGSYYFKVGKNTPWYPVTHTYSLAEWRYQMKTLVSTYIQDRYSNTRSAAFLSGIATGEFDDRIMSQEFAQFGLQHIMAISGFHFAIIASILSSFFKFILPKRQKILILIALLSAYFFFLGCGPSIMRAWMTISLALVAMWMGREGSGLNALGFALMFVLIVDPLLCRHMGFQFSFITTAAILLLYRVLDQLTQKFFYHRHLAITTLMTTRDQHAYCILTTLRQAAALGIAVNLVALPLTLYYFQNFPYLSLIYNLFFPFLVSFSMLLLLLGFFIPGLHFLNNYYTSFVLNFTHQMPKKVNFLLESSWINEGILILYLTILFGIGIVYQSFLSKKARSDFIYL